MLKMIIADDEAIVRRGLKNIICWEGFGIEIIAEATDGQEAFELCQELHPDILFTDIRMPLLDGLEVAMKLKELGSGIRVVIISGAQDFNYAKTAIDINVEGYVLKPVDMNKLNDVFKNVVNRIKLEMNQKSEMIQLKQQLHEHFPVIREKFLRNLIFGTYGNELEIQKKIQYFKIPFQVDESLLVSVLQIDDYSKITENTSEEDKQLLSFSISNIAEEIMTNYNAGVNFCIDETEFVLIYNLNTHVNGKYTEICEEIVSCLNKFLGISVSIGIGRPVNRISSVNLSYKDARTALQYKFYTGKNSILDINDINIINDISMENINSSDLYENESQLMNFIKLGDSESISKILGDLFNKMYLNRNIPVEYVQRICVEMVSLVSRTAQDLGKSLDSIVDKQSVILETIYKIENAYDLKSYITTIFIKVTEYFSDKYNQKNAKVINRVREIIENRYNEDISVARISEEIYLTPNYISMIFKQEMKETITEYITKVRMEQAKKLIKTTDLRILEIAEKVGYEDPHYFSKAFKKHTGIHPKMYRS